MVVCRRVEDRSVTDHPVLVVGGRGAAPAAWAGALIRAAWNQVYWGGIALPDARTKRTIASFLAEQDVHCVLAEFGPLGCIMQHAAAHARVPLYIYFRGRDATSLLRNSGVRRAYSRLFPAVAGIIAVSRFLLDNLRAWGFSHPNMHVIPSGADTSLFIPGSKDPGQLLSVGRFVAKKAPDVVIRAFARVAEQFPVRLDMIGDGPLLVECQRLAVSLGIADRVHFLGAQPVEVVRERMASATVLLQHSVTGPGGETEACPP